MVRGILAILGLALGTGQELQDLKVAPAWAPLVRGLSEPSDHVRLLDGSELDVEPLAQPVRPGQASDVAVVRVRGSATRRELRGSDVQAVLLFEDRLLTELAARLKAATVDDLDLAEKLASSAVRAHRSFRYPAPLAANPWLGLQRRLDDQLTEIRRRLLTTLDADGRSKEALARADAWVGLYSSASPLQDDIRALWVKHAAALLSQDSYQEVRDWLARIDRVFGTPQQAASLRAAVQKRAETLLAEARELPGAQALKPLQQALQLWPRLPGARDELERRRGGYQVVRVAVRTLPELMSPATAATDVEQQVLDLIFEGLMAVHDHPSHGKSYRPALLHELPEPGTQPVVHLRPDLYWADGTPVTAADVRHTLLLARHERSTWHECLEVPRFEGNRLQLALVYKRGMLDPFAPLTLRILPQKHAGRPLESGDDADFARTPVGSGPYQLAERTKDAVRFGVNPYHIRAGRPAPGSIREIEMVAWKDRPAAVGPPLPHLVWDVPTSELPSLGKLGYADLKTLPAPRVYFLAVNARRPALTTGLRRILGFAIDRQALLDHHFRSGGESPPHQSANGPFPRGSWAAASPPRVPADLYQPERVLPLLKQLAPSARLEVTLKYPDDDPRVGGACAELIRQVEGRFAEGGFGLTIRPTALPPRDLRLAIEKGDYDLAYQKLDHGDEPARLMALFDPERMGPGGSNYLGYDDAKLVGLLRSALQHRAFLPLRDTMHNVHAHIVETMPLVPLWQLDVHVAVHSSLRLPALDPLALFGEVARWQLGR